MARTDWSGDVALEAFDDGYEEGERAGEHRTHGMACDSCVTVGRREAAQDLMDALRAAGVRDDDWSGGGVVEVVTQWLDSHGIDMHVEPEDARES